MDNKIFINRNRLPPLVHDIVRETGLEAMAPGETTWCVPWMLESTEDGEVVIKGSSLERGQTPGGTVTLKLISDFDGLYVDATALSQEDLQRYLKPGARSTTIGDDGNRTHVGGVLYPYVNNTEGLEPDAVSSFNKDQRELRKQFSNYYKRTYGLDYTYAEQEVSRPHSGLPTQLGRLATDTQKPRRWGRS